MLLILHTSGGHWLDETLARNLGDDLAVEGHDSRLVTAEQLLDSDISKFGNGQDILVVNPFGPARREPGFLGDKIGGFQRRILFNVGNVYNPWLASHSAKGQSIFTDIFDFCMVPQIDQATLGACRYTWIPESFTRFERDHLVAAGGERPLVWSMIGRYSRDRAEVADIVAGTVSPSGLLFLPNDDTSLHFSANAMDRVLSKTHYYIWTSRHRVPHHESFRALHAIRNGAVPAKIDPLFAHLFQEIPWVYPSVSAFQNAIEMHGHETLYQRALQYILGHGTIGAHVAQALHRQPKHEIPNLELATK